MRRHAEIRQNYGAKAHSGSREGKCSGYKNLIYKWLYLTAALLLSKTEKSHNLNKLIKKFNSNYHKIKNREHLFAL
ncbi:hypothetical protein [Pseudochrobactrum sp. HB0163]|uniref:hypothetical protein n=1 Tax=Pseudochrobactrum sp. HB0163 TaxID=3450708 RepID=UPI003F6E1EC7